MIKTKQRYRQTYKQARELNRSTVKRQTKKLNHQLKTSNIRQKYGPSKKPSPVIVKRLDTNEVIGQYDQSKLTSRQYSAGLNRLARQAGYDDYATYLESSHWESIRQQVFKRDRYRCQICYRKSELQVHHDQYRDLDSNEIDQLKTICNTCHRKIHA